MKSIIVFQQSPFFFSDTRKGRTWCGTSALLFFLAFVAFSGYGALWFMGYAGAPPWSQWFTC